jgi:hypothetical protein
MKHRRYHADWPTADEEEAVRRDRSGVAVDVAIIAGVLILVFMVLPTVARLLQLAPMSGAGL